MERNQGLHILGCKRLVAADIAGESKVVEGHEDGISADEAAPEVNFAQCFIHHAAVHFGEPEIRSRKDAEHRRHTHHQVEVADHEVGRVQHDVNRGLRQKEAADASGDEHRDEPERKQRRRIDSQFGAVQAPHPDEHYDGRRNRDDQGGKREHQRRNRIHAADKHVVPVHHVAEDGERTHGIDQYTMAQHGLPHVGNEYVGNDAHPRHNRDVHLGVSEEPE